MDNLLEISAVRSLIKRSFPNKIETIIGELLQNSQRAGATWIDFLTPGKSDILIFDNGKGIDNFRDLIVLGKSSYDKQIIDWQHPMGVGFNALLAHDEVTRVTVFSGDKFLSIDTQRWWNDEEYAQNWQNLIESSEYSRGLGINIEASHSFVLRFKKCFESKKGYQTLLPAQGYELVNLKVSLNRQKVETGYPDWVKRGEVLFLDRYEENPLIIYSSPFGTSASFSLINWYGQLIKVETNLPFGFLYEVAEGRPLEPQAPVREGIVRDAKWQNFIGSIVDRIVEHFRSLVEPPGHYDVKGYYNMRISYPEIPHCPFFTARKALGYDEQDYESIERQGAIEVFRYRDYNLVNAPHPELIENRLYLHNIDEELAQNHLFEGYESFVRLLDKSLYLPVKYHPELLNERIKAFHWRVGESVMVAEHGYEYSISFHQAGEFALTKNVTKADWQPITKDVFAIAERTACCLSDCEAWLFGCTTTPVDAVEEYALAGYRHADSDCSNYFKEEIQSVIIDLSGKALGSDISRGYLKSFVAKEQKVEMSQIKNVGIIFGEDDTATVTAKVAGEPIEIKEVKIIDN